MSRPESSLNRLKSTLGPTEDQRTRMLVKIRGKMHASHSLHSLRDSLAPEEGAQIRIWNRIREQITVSRARGFLEQVRVYLTPESHGTFRLHSSFLPRLQPVLIPVRPLKWVAAFAILLVTIRVSPLLFLAPQTIAQSSVLLRPTKGTVAVSLDGFAQPIGQEIEILQPVTVHSGNGEFTAILHDDGTIRAAQNTSVTIQDLTDRPEKSSGLATLVLQGGTVWVQGLVPDHIRGISVVTPQGTVTVHGGSVSITVEGDDVTVDVWDRHARLEREDEADMIVVAGESLVASDKITITRMEKNTIGDPWTQQNLQRDGVHQQLIAQEQRERLAARAGFLSTSPLYVAKRVAEKMDVFFTFNREEAVKKRLTHATTRLAEAAAMIAEGGTGSVQLAEYRNEVLDIASGSGDVFTQKLIADSLEKNIAQLGATLPNDDVYVVKQIAMATTAQTPESSLTVKDVEASELADAIDSLQLAAVEGDGEAVRERLETLAPIIEDLNADETIDPTVKKEVLSQLTRVADTLQEEASDSDDDSVALRAVSRAVRAHVPAAPPVPLTDDQIRAMVASIMDNVFTYSQCTGQTNTLHQQIIVIKNHPDAGMILRELYEVLSEYEEVNSIRADGSGPGCRISMLVRAAMRDLREDQE